MLLQIPTRTLRSTRLSSLRALPLLALMASLMACSDTKKTTAVAPVIPNTNTYFAMTTEKPTTSLGGLSLGYTFTLDHSAGVIDQNDITGGPQIPISKGTFKTGNGFLKAQLNPYNGVTVTKQELGNWLVEQPGSMGFAYISAPDATGLDGVTSGSAGEADTSQSLIPFVSNAACPTAPKAQTYQFLTFPGNVDPQSWDYQTDAAYGSVQIATLQSGTVVNLTGIQQYLLPVAGVAAGTPVAANPALAAISGTCGPSSGGNLISVSYVDILGSAHYAELNVADGFFLEMNIGFGIEAQGVSNILGAGYGAVGLLQPSSAVDTGSLTGSSFKGFLHVPDSYTAASAFSGANGTSGTCAKFRNSLKGLATQPSSNTLFGGEFTANDPSTHTTSNCDIAIDLGPQDAKSNGLFTAATIYLGAAFPLNSSALGTGIDRAYSVPAIALAGQIHGLNAVFVLAEDTVAGLGHPLGVYLIQAK